MYPTSDHQQALYLLHYHSINKQFMNVNRKVQEMAVLLGYLVCAEIDKKTIVLIHVLKAYSKCGKSICSVFVHSVLSVVDHEVSMTSQQAFCTVVA